MVAAILISGFSQCLVLAGFLFYKSKQYPIFTLLMIIHLVFGVDLLLLFAQQELLISHRINACWGAIYAIVFFIFIRSCLGRAPSRKQIYIFLSPWCVLNALIIDFLIEPHNTELTLRHIFAGYFLLAIYLYFTIWASITVYRYQTKQKDYLANLSKENLWVLWGICASLFFAIATIPFQFVFQTNLPLPQLFMCFMMFLITYALLHKPQLLDFAKFEKFDKEPRSTTEMVNDFDIVLEEQILHLLDEDKIYTDPDLSLQSLANKLGMKPYLISQVINQHMGVSFYEMVNRRRINYTCELMKRHPNRPVLDIALQAGFNAKSTFNAAFKRYQAVTPTQYKANINGTH
ncbi:helix-turn-helix domain-containing protein [Pseudoalteromonas denitrificans]|uniref:AraC-type DNA-binding protein n=1 Tax=Pseudoalteromonas denitrificans DSM 6059 TaxID=1123010 RepID=A0A1I1UJA6_9GAMM|nr:helix-turn-helix domain-containing protein [Pseudoalteromonas denitrificans]SFD70675.1 AraC-type DNA-binding protein [Pseudoalteromonas denitrificans DSM 6059]